jgi:hypothetical protein
MPTKSASYKALTAAAMVGSFAIAIAFTLAMYSAAHRRHCRLSVIFKPPLKVFPCKEPGVDWVALAFQQAPVQGLLALLAAIPSPEPAIAGDSRSCQHAKRVEIENF